MRPPHPVTVGLRRDGAVGTSRSWRRGPGQRRSGRPARKHATPAVTEHRTTEHRTIGHLTVRHLIALASLAWMLVAGAGTGATAVAQVTAVDSVAAVPATAHGWVYPVGPPGGPPDVARAFDPPAQRWSPGHRGVDLRAPAGSPVRAAQGGDVVHAGPVAGRGVVVVRHGTLRTTYEPVEATVRAGSRVRAGEPIGTLATAGSHCAPASCLHWGAIEGDAYVDPLGLVGSPAIRLLPLGDRALTEAPPPEPSPQPEGVPPGPPSPAPPDGDGLRWPVANPYVTSPYGMRTHPITRIRKLHDGTDFRAPCGTPIRASAAGQVTDAGSRGAYGLRLTVEHGSIGGAVLTTSYSHLSRMDVTAGQRVGAGQVIGRAGTTGLSTGCHLHFMVHADGSLADPMRWLPGGASARSG